VLRINRHSRWLLILLGGVGSIVVLFGIGLAYYGGANSQKRSGASAQKQGGAKLQKQRTVYLEGGRSLGVNNLRFHVVDGSHALEVIDDLGNCIERPGGVYAYYSHLDTQSVLSLRGKEVRRLHEKIRHEFSTDSNVRFHAKKRRGGIVLVGRLSGGMNTMFLTTISGIEQFVLSGKKISIVANCEFTGPYEDGEPNPEAIYFVAVIGNLLPGTYQATISIEPTGSVHEEYQEYGLPSYAPMKCKFDVE